MEREEFKQNMGHIYRHYVTSRVNDGENVYEPGYLNYRIRILG